MEVTQSRREGELRDWEKEERSEQRQLRYDLDRSFIPLGATCTMRSLENQKINTSFRRQSVAVAEQKARRPGPPAARDWLTHRSGS